MIVGFDVFPDNQMDPPTVRTAAKPKGNRAPEEASQQPMRPTQQIRQSPSADQLKARKQMLRKSTSTKENQMHREADILRAMASASLAEQRDLATELDALRRGVTARRQADRDTDLADTMVRSHLTPILTHASHTGATDWLDTEDRQGDPTQAMKTEATLWFAKTSAALRGDLDEFALQAQGSATRHASRCGEMADQAFEAFLGQVDHLYRQAAKIAEAGGSEQIDADQQSGDAMSGLPVGVDNAATAFDDGGFLDEDTDGAVHPEINKGATKTAISLTNVGIDGDHGVGTNPSGDRVTFRITDKEKADLQRILQSDLAINFSGVDIEEGDIIKGAARTAAFDDASESGDDSEINTQRDDDEDNADASESGDGTPQAKDARRHVAAPDSEYSAGYEDAAAGREIDPAHGSEEYLDGYDDGLDEGMGQKAARRHHASDGPSCSDCGASIERDPAGEDNRGWHHNDGDSHDHQAQSGKEASRYTAAETDSINPNQDNGHANSTLPSVQVGGENDRPAWPMELTDGDPAVGTGAADVADAVNPNSHTSMLDKAAAFRATVAHNLARI